MDSNIVDYTNDFITNMDNHISYFTYSHYFNDFRKELFEHIIKKISLENGEHVILIKGYGCKKPLKPKYDSIRRKLSDDHLKLLIEIIIVTDFSKLYHIKKYNVEDSHCDFNFFVNKNIKLKNINMIQTLFNFSVKCCITSDSIKKSIRELKKNVLFMFKTNEQVDFNTCQIIETSNEKSSDNKIHIEDNENVTELNNKISELSDKVSELNNKIKSFEDNTSGTCCICLEIINQRVTCLPCGHASYCVKCIGTIKQCGMCNVNITSILKIYY